jgi:hypothetical protein
MRELIDGLPTGDANFLLDTCFFIHALDDMNKLRDFCSNNSVGMSQFNLLELEHVHHELESHKSHRIRELLKEKIFVNVPVDVTPGDREGEKGYVQSFDPEILNIIPDASDAVLFVQAMKTHADILTRDRHHIFTAAAENYYNEFRLKILNNYP